MVWFQVPFIANYRKEYVEPELSVEDLWTIWQWDERVGVSLWSVLHLVSMAL